MNKRILKIVGWAAALLLLLGVGAVVGGGLVYATTRDNDAVTLTFQPEGEKPFEAEPGIVISAVVPDGPADEAGVARGDILLQIDGEAVNDVAGLMRVLEQHEAGDEVELTVRHGDEERTLTATLGDRDDVAYLGVVPCAGIPVSESRVMLHTAEPGAVIAAVTPDSPADRAGLQAGDVIVAVDEQELTGENNLGDVIASYEPGDTVTLQVERSGEEAREVSVELGEHPDKEGVAYLGVQCSPVWPARVLEGEWLPFSGPHGGPFFPGDLSLHTIPEGGTSLQGAIVRRVDEDSPAEAAGLRQGDVITAVDDTPVETPGDLADIIAAHEPGDQVTLTVFHPGDEEDEAERQIEVTLAEHPEEEGEAYLGARIGGFVHIHRSGDGQEHELEFNFDGSLDDLPLEMDDSHFEFHLPREHLDDGETVCCGESA
jgi:S1-C subfamily serine protease